LRLIDRRANPVRVAVVRFAELLSEIARHISAPVANREAAIEVRM